MKSSADNSETWMPFAMHWSRSAKQLPELSGCYDPISQSWSHPNAASVSTFSRTGTTNFAQDPDEDRDD
jgi:hypothetical protein